jgi:hypothetical protein
MENFTSDPNAINAAAAELNNPDTPAIKTVAPSNTEVSLPGGFIAGDGSLVKYAEVRELTGSDEEAISKSGSIGRVLVAMLQRGLVSIGDQPAKKDDLDSLLSGDRDALLIGIRKVTFGDSIEYTINCPSCSTELDVAVDLNKDIPYKELEDPINGRSFTYKSKTKGEIVVSLPTGLTQRKLLENNDKTRAELNTILLAGCVDSVNGAVSLGASTVLGLGMADREAIIAEIVERNPGPRLGEVKTTCEACGEDIPMPLSLADLFRL